MIDFDGPVSNWLPTVWYGGYLPDMPDLCVGQLPRGFGREWKIWIVETPREQMALTEALRLPITRRGLSLDFSATLDAAVRSPGTGRPFIGLYPPPESGWPWIVIGRFDKTIGAALGLARGIYSVETDASESDALDRINRLRLLEPEATIVIPPRAPDKN